MSATLAQSLAWDQMPRNAKLAAAGPLLRGGEYYTVAGDWGTALALCLNADTRQFRMVSVQFNTAGNPVDLWGFGHGWMVTLAPDVLATAQPSKPPHR